MMRLLYSLALYLATPVILALLATRAWREPGYRAAWLQRFGLCPPQVPQGAIWLHAASVGEVQAVAALVRELRTAQPDVPLVLTTMTPAGAAHARRLFGLEVACTCLPFDYPHAVALFLRALRPRLAVVVEMELWPNLFAGLRRHRVPLLLVNARLSAASARNYRRVRPLIAGVLACPQAIAAQTRQHARRLVCLGAPPERVHVAGNLKFDVTLPPSAREQGEALRALMGGERPVWIAASTREGEEERILEAFAQVQEQLPDALLILVPRHPDRFAEVAARVRQGGFNMTTRSSGALPGAETSVFLGDTMGELPVYYAAADLAFVGGSLVPMGGQNVLEPAALGMPVVVGPSTFNFEAAAAQLVARDAMVRVADVHELAATVVSLLGHPERRAAMGRQGCALIDANRGATGQVRDLVLRHLPA